MFNVISHNLNPDAPEYSAFTEDSAAQKAEFARRTEVLKEFVGDLATRAGIESAITDGLSIDFYETFSGAEVHRKYGIGPLVMSLPLLLFFDFVKDFQADSLEDFKQKLNDPVWSQAFADKFTHVVSASSLVANHSMREEIQSYAQQLIDDPERMLDVEKFIVLHELGHLKHGDHGFCAKGYQLLSALIGLMAGLPLIGIGLFLSTGVLLLDVGLFVACVYLAVRVMFIVTDIVFVHLFGRSSEIAADQFAISALPGAEGEKIRQGGIAFFEACEKRGDKKSWFDRLRDPHPTYRARIEMLQNYQSTIPNNPQLAI